MKEQRFSKKRSCEGCGDKISEDIKKISNEWQKKGIHLTSESIEKNDKKLDLSDSSLCQNK